MGKIKELLVGHKRHSDAPAATPPATARFENMAAMYEAALRTRTEIT